MMPLSSLLLLLVVFSVLYFDLILGTEDVNDLNTITKASCRDHRRDDSNFDIDITTESVCATDNDHESTDHCRDDLEDCLDRSIEGLCDTDPFVMLLHCRKSCLICPQVGMEQNVGLSDTRVPLAVSIDILTVIRETNLYYRTQILNGPTVTTNDDHPSYDQNTLVRRSCQNRHELCSLWKLQNRCSSPDYGEFVTTECPLACQQCHTEQYRVQSFLQLLSETLPEAYYSSHVAMRTVDIHQEVPVERNVVDDRFRTLSLLMSILGMDPGLIGKPFVNVIGNEDNGDGAGFTNWLQHLHGRIMAVIPSPLLQLYDPSTLRGDTANAENLLRNLLGPQPNNKKHPNKWSIDDILVVYRHRGYVVAPMLDFDHFITRPIQLAVGFAVPNEPALRELESLGRILQMGAGTGYWTALLRTRGVDIVAYDLHPPAGGENLFFDADYSNGTVERGDCVGVLSKQPDLAQGRALLMIWPNDPDPIDNPEFCDGGPVGEHGQSVGSSTVESEAVWDTACLMAYIEAGGESVVYVGEREDVILSRAKLSHHHAVRPESGLSATRAFQQTLQSQFELVKTVEIPNWWLNEDDMTIWKRKHQ